MLKELFKNTSVYLVTGGINQVVNLSLWIILAKIISPEQIGSYSLVMFWIELFSALAMFGLDAVFTRFYYRQEEKKDILMNGLKFFILSGLLSSLLFIIFALKFSWISRDAFSVVLTNIGLFGTLIFFNALGNLSFAHYTALKEAFSYAKIQLIRSIVFFSLSLGLVLITKNIIGVFYGLFFSSFLVSIFFIFKEKEARSLSLPLLREMVSYGFPLMLYSVLGTLVGYFGRLLLNSYTDLATLGVYSFFLGIILQLNGLWGSFNRAWTPIAFEAFSGNREEGTARIKTGAYFSTFMYCGLVLLAMLLGKALLFKIIFQPIYIENLTLFYVLLLAPLFTGIYTVFYPLYYYEYRTKRILAITLIISLINTSLTFLMVKLFSQVGAALSVFLVSVITVISYLLAFRKIADISKEILGWVFLVSLICLIGSGMMIVFNPLLWFSLTVFSVMLVSFLRGRFWERKELIVSLVKRYGR